MGRRNYDRRNFMDRVRISELFALICTGLMLLTLFLLSATGERDHAGVSHAGFGAAVPTARRTTSKNLEGDPLPAPASIAEPEAKPMRVPVRTIDRVDYE